MCHQFWALSLSRAGGSVTAGLGIYDTMQSVRPPVATWCVGQACSMGAFLLAAGKRGLRHSLPNSRIMIHQPHGATGVIPPPPLCKYIHFFHQLVLGWLCTGIMPPTLLILFYLRQSYDLITKYQLYGNTTMLLWTSGVEAYISVTLQMLCCLQGQASDIAIHAEEFIKLKSLLNRLLAQHTGQPVETIGGCGPRPIPIPHVWGSTPYQSQISNSGALMNVVTSLL